MNLDPKTIMAWFAVASVVTGGLKWTWDMHNEVLITTVTTAVAPLIENDKKTARANAVMRINNYRRKACLQTLSDQEQIAFEEVWQEYIDLVGRPISPRGCDSL